MERSLGSSVLHGARVRLIQDYPAQIGTCLDVLTGDEIWWRPHEQANAVGNLVVHLIGSNRYYVEYAIGGADLDRDREAEFAARNAGSKDSLRDAWQASVHATAAVLDRLDEATMLRTTERTGKTSTMASILLHVTHHNAAHMGQIVWVTKMLHPGSLDDIWRKGGRKGAG